MKSPRLLRSVIITLIILVCLTPLIFLFCITPPSTSPNEETDKNAGKIEIPSAVFATVCKLHEGQPVKNTCLESILLFGFINDAMYEAFIKRLNESVANGLNIENVCVHSQGGYPGVALEISKEIRNRKLNTCIGTYAMIEPTSYGGKEKLYMRRPMKCDSSCPFLFMSGMERIGLGNGLAMSVHQAGATWYCPICYGTKLHSFEILNSDFREMKTTTDKYDQEGFDTFYQIAMKTNFSEINLGKVSDACLIKLRIFTKLDSDNTPPVHNLSCE